MEHSKYTILVVDDEGPLRNLIATFLARFGHGCVKATDGMDALDKVKENKIDAVIADIKMPRMDGIMLTAEIAKDYPHLPVMVMTGFAEEYTAEGAISAGAREFIQKPFSIEEFTLRFNKMMRDSESLRQENRGSDVDHLLSELEATLIRS